MCPPLGQIRPRSAAVKMPGGGALGSQLLVDDRHTLVRALVGHAPSPQSDHAGEGHGSGFARTAQR